MCIRDSSCTGVDPHAFDKLAQMVEEIYIPANITYIAPDAFENLTNLIYIEVAPVSYTHLDVYKRQSLDRVWH